MLDPASPVYAPILLPNDLDALQAIDGGLEAAVISAASGVSAGGRNLVELARARAGTLLADPRTPVFQFEGYVSMEDLRKLPYSPGRATLGTLWQPGSFATREARARLIDAVLETQLALDADILIAPYFFVARVEHAWLPVAAQVLAETLDSSPPRPVAAAVCVDIDGILREPERDTLARTMTASDPAAYLLTVVNFDELAATPDEMRAVLDLIARLAARAPTSLTHAGRSGLTAIVAGAAGYSGGTLELEAHPRRYLREGLVNLHAHRAYLPGCMLSLPVRLAEAVRRVEPQAAEDAAPLTSLVNRKRGARALSAKLAETRWLAGLPLRERRPALRASMVTALARCRGAQRALAEGGGRDRLDDGAFHYLEVLLEASGGPRATMPTDAGF